MALNENTVARSRLNGSGRNFGESLTKVSSTKCNSNEPNPTTMEVSVELESSTNQKQTKYKNSRNNNFTKQLKTYLKSQTKIIRSHLKMPSIPQKKVSETEQYKQS